MSQDILKQNVLPDGTINTRVGAGKVINPLSALDDTAKIVYKIGQDYKQAQEDDFESSLKLEQAKFNDKLKTINNEDDFNKAISDYNANINNLGVAKLGEKGYQRWTNSKGKNYFEYANMGYKSIWTQNMQNQTYATMQNNVDNYASLANMYRNNDKLRDNYIKVCNNDIEQKWLSPEQKNALKIRFNSQLSVADVMSDIDDNPEVAMKKLQETQVDKKNSQLKQLKYYTGLTPVQRQQYLEVAQREYDAQLNTYQDKKINKLKSEFNDLYQNYGYEAAFKYMQENIKNLDSIIKEEGITQEQFQSFKTYADGVLKNQNSEYAVENQEKYGQFQVDYNKFFIKKNKKTGEIEINNKDLNNVESIVAMINNIDNSVADGTYYIHQKDVLNKKAQFQELLGNMVDKRIKLKNTSYFWQDDTASEYIAESIKNTVLINNNNRFEVNKLDAKQKGQIFEHIYKSCLASGIDLASKDAFVKQKVDKITRAYFDLYIRNMNSVPDKNYSGVVGNGSVYSLDENSADNNIGAKSGGYGKYQVDSNGNRILKDSNGNIVDEVK